MSFKSSLLSGFAFIAFLTSGCGPQFKAQTQSPMQPRNEFTSRPTSVEESKPELNQNQDKQNVSHDTPEELPVTFSTPEESPEGVEETSSSSSHPVSKETAVRSQPNSKSTPHPTSPHPTSLKPKTRPDADDTKAEEIPSETTTLVKGIRPRARPDDLLKRHEKASAKASEETKEETPSGLPVNVTGLWEETSSSGRRWTQITAEAMETYGKELLATTPSDIKSFCPKFSTLDRDGKMSFWVNLLSAIAIRESRLRPGASYTEKFKDSTGTEVVSRGLLQISIESSRSYKCPAKSAKDLHDEEVNLICGVKILNRWIPFDKKIQGRSGKQNLGAGRYWSVMRKGESLNWIQSQMLSLDFCK